MPTIGVRWGYGSDEELRAAGVVALVDRPADIGAIIQPRAAAAIGARV
jgi:phosphoglycolate phosphatase-like HAD superfamily hydrolase